jgi:hypothetical protein
MLSSKAPDSVFAPTIARARLAPDSVQDSCDVVIRPSSRQLRDQFNYVLFRRLLMIDLSRPTRSWDKPHQPLGANGLQYERIAYVNDSQSAILFQDVESIVRTASYVSSLGHGPSVQTDLHQGRRSTQIQNVAAIPGAYDVAPSLRSTPRASLFLAPTTVGTSAVHNRQSRPQRRLPMKL